MNPFFRRNNPPQNQPRRSPSPRPAFFRKGGNNNDNERNGSIGKQEKPKQNTGLYWKIKGNEAYQKGNFELAIKYYNKAIVKFILNSK